MSLIAHRPKIGASFSQPVNTQLASGTGSTSTYNIVPTTTPTNGNLVIILAGGSQNRSVSTPPGTGFTAVPSSGGTPGTNVMYWKIASGEPASYSIVFGGALDGGWVIFEVRDIDTASPFLFHTGTSGSAVTTLAMTSYNASIIGTAWTYSAKSSTGVWTADNSFSNIVAAGQFRIAAKVHTSTSTGNNVSWNGPSENITADIFYIKGKRI